MQSERLQEYIDRMSRDLVRDYSIPAEMYENQDIKRGLRNNDGTACSSGSVRSAAYRAIIWSTASACRCPANSTTAASAWRYCRCAQQAGTFGYEEVAYLLLLGRLPAAEELAQFNQILANARQMPAAFTEDMILKAPSRNIMNQLARSVLALYSFDDNADDASPENILRQSIELIARFPLIAANALMAKRHYFEGNSLYLHNPLPELSVAENLLRMTRADKSYTAQEAHLLDLMLILHAEHSSNNSTFVCRAISSSGTDTYSAIAGAVGSLKGPLHGGANAKVLQMFRTIRDTVGATPTDEALGACLDDLLDGKTGDRSGKLYGLGHAVYTMSDPRAIVIKKYAAALAREKGRLDDLELMERVEELGIQKITARQASEAADVRQR